jgi:hypothetical protein
MVIVPILDSDNVFRRVPKYNPNYIKPDGSVTSLAFKTKRGEDGLSVDLERFSTVEKSILDSSKFALYSLNVGIIRQIKPDKMDVEHNPQEDNEAHCLIIPEVSDKNAKKIKLCAEQAG